MPKGVKGFQKGHETSEETRRKIGETKSRKIYFECDYCGVISSNSPSHFNRKKRHFCSQKCYSDFRRELLPKEEQNAYGCGLSELERILRRKVRSDTNHAIRSGALVPQPCRVCGDKAQAHHKDYSKPLDVDWLCFVHHRQEHKENKDLLGGE